MAVRTERREPRRQCSSRRHGMLRRRWIRDIDALGRALRRARHRQPLLRRLGLGATRDDGGGVPGAVRPAFRGSVPGGRAAALRRLLVRRRHRRAPGPAPRTARDPPVPGLAERFPTRKFGERPTRSYREAGDDDATFPGDLPPQPLDQHAERSRQRHRGDHRHPGVLRAQHALQQSKGSGGTLLDDLAHLPGRGPRAVGRGRRLPVPARRSPDRRDPRRRRRARPAPDSEGRPLVGVRERARGQPAHARLLLQCSASTTRLARIRRQVGGSTMDSMSPRPAPAPLCP